MHKKSILALIGFIFIGYVFSETTKIDVDPNFDTQKVLENISKDYLQKKLFGDKSPMLVWSGGLGRLEIGFYNRVETFYADHLSLLSKSKYDQLLYFKDTTDIKFFANQADVLRSRLVIRNVFRAGEPETLGTTSESFVKILDSEEGLHKHYIGKLLFWIREAWFEATLNDIFCLNTKGKHYFKIGVFPFALGRGIALGDAFAVSPGILGFYSNNVIDQYAPGFLFYGDIVPDRLEYDFYFSMLRNYSGTFKEVNQKIYKNEIGRSDTPWRGFGKIDFVFATRFIWLIPDVVGPRTVLRIEPYAFFNNDPEQKVDFEGDAETKLATLGTAFDYEGELFEWGLELGANFGSQKLRGWDKNMPKEANRDGTQVVEYTKVFVGAPPTPPAPDTRPKALVSDANRVIVDSSPQGAAFNNQEIGNSGLYNAEDRFRAARSNTLSGAMFVADASLTWNEKVKLSSCLQIASGDENPNRNPFNDTTDNPDTTYSGFIPFQSIYSGKRVLSLFFLGTGRVARPLTVPPNRVTKERVATVESGFTNLMLLGFGSDIITNAFWCKDTRIRPNVLFGWKAHATKKYDHDVNVLSSIEEAADRYLGVEFNLFAETELYKNLRLFLVTGFFLPGSYFADVKGIPFNADHLAALKNPVCGEVFGYNSPPVLSNHPAYLLNVGLIFNF
jgi:hypothetical protein